MVAVAFPGDIGATIGTLAGAAKKTYYAAQTFLPRDPFILAQNLTQDSTPTHDRLRDILERNTGSGVPYVRGSREPADARDAGDAGDAGDAWGEALRRGNEVLRRALPIPGIPSIVDPLGTARAAVAVSEWFDVQRLGFLILGFIFVGIGTFFVVRNVGDIDLDNRLKRAQLKATETTIDLQKAALNPPKPKEIEEPKSKNKGGAKRIKAAAKRAGEAARLPPYFFNNPGSGPTIDAKPRKPPSGPSSKGDA
jgi:hypothetical protein